MPQSLSNVVLHTVFSTKNGVPFLENPDLRLETYRYLGGVAKALKGELNTQQSARNAQRPTCFAHAIAYSMALSVSSGIPGWTFLVGC